MRQKTFLLIFFITVATTLSACSITLPVNGKMGNAEFLGQATGYMDRTGDLVITTTDNTSCTGDFEYTGSSMGEGTFKCADGKIGNFHFTSNGRSGKGFGKTSDGEKFEFTFGNPTSRVQMY